MNDLPISQGHHSDKTDHGFTLIEVLIVVVTMAVIATAIAATVTVVLRTSPSAEVRADDARSLQGLVTWIPQDVDAAPPDGFDTDVTAWPCGGAAPANSYSLVSITWDERTDVSTSEFAAAYRYEFDGTTWHIVRYSCDDLTTAPAMGVAERQNLTAELPPWDNLAPPASVTMCDAEVDSAGNCPAGSVILTNTSPDVESLKLRVTRIDGIFSTIDAAPKNPDQDLADDPNATTNFAPTVSASNYTLDMFAGDTTTIDLNATHVPTDADGDTLSVALDSSEPVPAGVTASTADPLFVTVTADASLPVGTLSPKLTFIISDPNAGWVDALVTVRIIPEPNAAPQVSPASYALQIAPGQIVVLPLAVTHGAFDPNGDPMTTTVVSWPNRVFQPTVTGPLDVRIEAKSSAPIGPAVGPVEVLIQDNRGGFVSAWITIEIVPAAVNNDPTVATTNVNISMFSGDSITLSLGASHGASDPDGDPISASLDGSMAQPPGLTTTFGGGLDVTITADPSIADGPVAIPVSLLVTDAFGADVEATVTVTIDPTPPPPSDCVLGSLNATPNPVDRQGNGSGPRHLKNDVTVTINYAGSCDGLVLKYDTGDTSGLGIGTGRVFPPGSPSSIVIYGKGNGGTEKWLPGNVPLTASTTSAVTPNSVTITLNVT